MADGRKIEDKRCLVDVERGRTVPNWCDAQLLLQRLLCLAVHGREAARTAQMSWVAGGCAFLGPFPICCSRLHHLHHITASVC